MRSKSNFQRNRGSKLTLVCGKHSSLLLKYFLPDLGPTAFDNDLCLNLLNIYKLKMKIDTET